MDQFSAHLDRGWDLVQRGDPRGAELSARRALYEIGEFDSAFPLIDDAVNRNVKNAEAWYYLGLLRDERGDSHGATAAFLASRDLDLELGTPPWSLSRETFEMTARAALLS